MNHPSTPPRSRHNQSSNVVDDTLTFGPSLPSLNRKVTVEPATPQKNTSLTAPVTPSTVQKHQLNSSTNSMKNGIPLLLHPRNQQQAMFSPFNGLKSPEFVSQRRSSITKTNTDNDKILQNVSRILFPNKRESDDEESGTEDTQTFASQSSLLPPKRTKHHKEVPATPSDKLISFKLAEEWNNNSSKTGAADSDSEEEFINKGKLINPFESTKVPSRKLRNKRMQILKKENGRIDKEVTYLNKNGEIVKTKEVSDSAIKPKMLFEREIYENCSNTDFVDSDNDS
ncbi:hypothetical protein KAFR_0D00820 [Kazachstania africana CBS 2517]|uniref:Uncharacterized protein n=1 Tax=Kazachstania africana (strain ATCC 22294 / BCRC 22015 / CBS 2517 / CECT 1963 / NBRC 1671 / NRRL Y-8276) TaxID=1071382 RepID=H2ATM9_KAZAF|nr:hypothetical protein KAFR_0D00820 [Kazachstania africana CBS 2517]CCF57729.1 hypothetical protein KAFR_0D00820 [Kazachstania africana CBS 2517]